MKQLIDILIIICFALFIMASIIFTGYSLYALHAVSNATALTSIGLSVISFGMAIATAYQFKV